MVKRYGPSIRRSRKPKDPEWSRFMTLEEKEAERQSHWKNKSLADTGLSVRVVNCLENAGILTVGDLGTQTAADLLSITNFGAQTLRQCKRLLDNLEMPNQLDQ